MNSTKKNLNMSSDSTDNTVELGQIKSSKCYINIDYILQDQKISFEVFKSSLDTNCVLFKRNIPLDKMYQSKSCTQIQSNCKITYLKADKMIQTDGKSWLSPFLSPDNLGPPPFYRSGTPNANRNYESPVRDKPQQKAAPYKENYEVSKFKFPELSPVPRNAQMNFCELSFDGTRPKKQKHSPHRHNKMQVSAKKVKSDTKLNYLKSISPENKHQQEEFSKCIRDKLDRYCAKHHKQINLNKQEVIFDELPAQMAKKSAPSPRPKSRRKEKTAFELVLSTKDEKIEKPSKEHSRNTSPRRKPKKIIVTSTTLEPLATYVHKYNLQSSDTKDTEKEPEKLVPNDSLNELFVKPNFRRPSTEKSNHGEMDQHSHHHKKKKRKKHLTMTMFPCLEIKCSSKHLEMPVEPIVRPKMPRRTITQEENKILTSSVKEQLTLNEQERKNLIEHRLISQPNKVFNDHQEQLLTCSGFVTTCNNPSQPSIELTSNQNNIQIPSQEDSFVSALNEEKVHNVETPKDVIKTKLTNIFKDNKTDDYNKKIEDLCTLIGNLITSEPEKNIKKLHRSRSATPERERSHLTSNSVKKPSNDSTDVPDMLSTSKIFNTSTVSFPTAINSTHSYPAKVKNLQMVHNKNQAVTISEDTSKYTLCDNCDLKKSSETIKTVPKNVFVIPSHVNKILKQYDMKKTGKPSSASANTTADQTNKQEKYNLVETNNKSSDVINYKLTEVVKNPSIRPKLVKSPKKSELILPKKPLHSGISKIVKDENSYSAVTFNSQVDIYENYRENKPHQKKDEINVKNTLIHVSSKTAIKRSKTLPSKQDFYKKNYLHSPKSTDTYDSKHSGESNHGFQSDRQMDKKPRPGSILNSTFLSSKKETTNPNNTFQKRKEYYNKLKMQMKKANESDMEKTTEYETSFPKSSCSSIIKQNSVATSNHSSVSENAVTEIKVIKSALKCEISEVKNKVFKSRIPKLIARPTKTNLAESQPKSFLKFFPLQKPESARDVNAPVTYTQLAKNQTQPFEKNINSYFNSASYKILSRNSTILATERRRRFLKKHQCVFAQNSDSKESNRQILYTILNSYPPRPQIDVYLNEIKKQGYVEHSVMQVKENSELKNNSHKRVKKLNEGVDHPETKKLKKYPKDSEVYDEKKFRKYRKARKNEKPVIIKSNPALHIDKTTKKVSFHVENKKEFCKNCNGFFCKCCKPHEVDDSSAYFKFPTKDSTKSQLYPVLIEQSNVFQNTSKRKRKSKPQDISDSLSSRELINFCGDLLLTPEKLNLVQSNKSKNNFVKTVNRINHFFRRKTSDLVRIVTRKKQDNG